MPVPSPAHSLVHFGSSGRIALTALRCLLGVRELKMGGIIQFFLESVKHERACMSHIYGSTLYDFMRLSIIVSTMLNPWFLYTLQMGRTFSPPTFIPGFGPFNDAILRHGMIRDFRYWHIDSII